MGLKEKAIVSVLVMLVLYAAAVVMWFIDRKSTRLNSSHGY